MVSSLTEHIVRLRKSGIGAEMVSFHGIDNLLLIKLHPNTDTLRNSITIGRPSFTKRYIYSLFLRSPYKTVGLLLYDILVVDRYLSLKCMGFVKSSRVGGIALVLCNDGMTYCKIYEKVGELMPEVSMFVVPARLSCAKPLRRRILVSDHPIEWLRRVVLFVYPVGRGAVA